METVDEGFNVCCLFREDFGNSNESRQGHSERWTDVDR